MSKAPDTPRRASGVVDDGQAREGGAGVLVVQRHQQGRALRRLRRMRAELQVLLLAAGQQHPETDGGAGEPAGDGGDQHQEQAERRDLQRVEAMTGIQGHGRNGGQGGHDDGQGRQDQATTADRHGRGGRRGALDDGITAVQRLARHGHRGLFGQPCPGGPRELEVQRSIGGVDPCRKQSHSVRAFDPDSGPKNRAGLLHCSTGAMSITFARFSITEW